MEKSQMLTLSDDTDIFVRTMGEGPELFLLHGNGQDSSYFDNNTEELSQHFHLYLVDFRDHGKSNNARKELSFEIMASDLNEIFNILNIKSSHILGFSDGANLALILEKLYPDRVKSLILNAPNTRFDGITPLGKAYTYFENIFWRILPFFRRNRRVSSLLLKDLKIDKEDLQAIDKKVLIIVGKNDIIRLEHIRGIAKNIKGSELRIIPGQGHSLARKDPENFNKIVIEFLKGVDDAEIP